MSFTKKNFICKEKPGAVKKVNQLGKLRNIIALFWNFGISIMMLSWRKHKIWTSFKTLGSKKVVKWHLKKFQSNNKLSRKVMSFSYHIYGMKNTHGSKLYQQHAHWRKDFLQMPLLKVCGSFLVRKQMTYFGLFESFLHFQRQEDKKKILLERQIQFSICRYLVQCDEV